MEFLVYNSEDTLQGVFPSLMEAVMFVESGDYIKEKELDKMKYIVYDDDGYQHGEFTDKEKAIAKANELPYPCVVVAEEVIYSKY